MAELFKRKMAPGYIKCQGDVYPAAKECEIIQ